MPDLMLEALRREPGHPRRTRAEGFVPGVVYGPKSDPLSVQVEGRALNRLLEGGGRRQLLHLTIDGGTKGSDLVVLIKEVQRDPVSSHVTHIDFFAVDLRQKITAPVGINFLGEAGLALGGLMLQYQLRELEVECLPANLPVALEADVAHLRVGDSLTVAEVPSPKGVKILNNPEEVVVSVIMARAAQQPEAGEGAAGELARGDSEAGDER